MTDVELTALLQSAVVDRPCCEAAARAVDAADQRALERIKARASAEETARRVVVAALEPLTDGGRWRVVRSVVGQLDIDVAGWQAIVGESS